MNYFIALFGLLFIVFGSILRWASIIQLKGAFTVDVAINREHDLKTDGMYKKLRHPSYLGLLMILSGLSIGMNNLLSFLAITLPVFFAILNRINVEETVLMEEFGEKYREYCKVTRKILPYIY
jgi:protein-S-isoprenylcysteine O-methyltransferase Ste14